MFNKVTKAKNVSNKCIQQKKKIKSQWDKISLAFHPGIKYENGREHEGRATAQIPLVAMTKKEFLCETSIGKSFRAKRSVWSDQMESATRKREKKLGAEKLYSFSGLAVLCGYRMIAVHLLWLMWTSTSIWGMTKGNFCNVLTWSLHTLIFLYEEKKEKKSPIFKSSLRIKGSSLPMYS